MYRHDDYAGIAAHLEIDFAANLEFARECGRLKCELFIALAKHFRSKILLEHLTTAGS